MADKGGELLNNQDGQVNQSDSPPKKCPRVDNASLDDSQIERDPGKRQMIWKYPVEKRDEIRRLYLRAGPYQVAPPVFKGKGRKFLTSWYESFKDWLEYSPTENAAFCLPCFLFSNPDSTSTFVVGGFKSWKKVNAGNDCAFLSHVGKTPNSLHRVAVGKCHDLMNSLQHIDMNMDQQSQELVVKNRLRLKVSIEVAKLCAFQGIAFRGHDESIDSYNRGNFLEIIKHTTAFNDDVASVVLENAPQNATYTSPAIQKEILPLYESKIQRFIRSEIGDEKYYLIVDESRDESAREQMCIILRFVDREGFVRERFFDIVHVKDTKALTLKEEICKVLAHHNLSTQNIRGQGYDGASNMRGEWNVVSLKQEGKRIRLKVFNVQVLEDIEEEKYYVSSRSSAREACEKSQDILNATELVANTKENLENFREKGWNELLENVKKFCEKHDVNAPDMNDRRLSSKGHPRKADSVTSEHYYRVEIFIGTIDVTPGKILSIFSEILNVSI
ncbi:uncharacterized protein LOC141826831 [Curcuma longa]|uniref:uncharacterized protein LOC141826831 n=1 Tax=Curcuma longa TaxID=136217 RepID=UPI003D9F6A7A